MQERDHFREGLVNKSSQNLMVMKILLLYRERKMLKLRNGFCVLSEKWSRDKAEEDSKTFCLDITTVKGPGYYSVHKKRLEMHLRNLLK